MKHESPLKDLGRYGTVGLELVLSILLGFFGGRFLDRRFETAPWLSLVGLLVGVYAGFRSIYKVYKQMQRAAERETEDDARRLASGEEPSDRVIMDDSDALNERPKVAPGEESGKTGGAKRDDEKQDEKKDDGPPNGDASR